MRILACILFYVFALSCSIGDEQKEMSDKTNPLAKNVIYRFEIEKIEKISNINYIGYFVFVNDGKEIINLPSFNDVSHEMIAPCCEEFYIKKGSNWVSVHKSIPTIDVTYKNIPYVRLQPKQKCTVVIDMSYIGQTNTSHVAKVSLGKYESKHFKIVNYITNMNVKIEESRLLSEVKRGMVKSGFNEKYLQSISDPTSLIIDSISHAKLACKGVTFVNEVKSIRMPVIDNKGKIRFSISYSTDVKSGMIVHLMIDTSKLNNDVMQELMSNARYRYMTKEGLLGNLSEIDKHFIESNELKECRVVCDKNDNETKEIIFELEVNYATKQASALPNEGTAKQFLGEIIKYLRTKII